MPTDSFPPEVIEQLKWYVYRLIDPRNGETFYVGKGRNNRVFTHANGLPDDGADEVSDPKLQRIKEIQAAGFEVAHVIHRHGIDSSKTALQIEAALIDAYPGLTNKVKGQGSNDYGCRHVKEIIDEYAAEEFEVTKPLMVITINRSFYQLPVYDAVRFAWGVNVDRARQYCLVLASLRGLVVGAFKPTAWHPATREHFPELYEHYGHTTEHSWLYGFNGEPAEPEDWNYYVRKRVPSKYRGSQIAWRYCHPDDA